MKLIGSRWLSVVAFVIIAAVYKLGDFRSEVVGCSLSGLRIAIHAVRAVYGTDVPEAAFLSARHAGGRLVGRDPADQRSQVLYELVVHSLRRYADRVVQVGGLPLSLRVRKRSSALGMAYR